jgi:hypothetical protein
MARTAAELVVECLESEGVEHVFGIPGEETLDLNAALADSSIGPGSASARSGPGPPTWSPRSPTPSSIGPPSWR